MKPVMPVMKLKQIALAVAAACVAAPSFALTPAQITANPGTIQLWISGATAPTASVYKAIRTLCLDADTNGTPDNLHVYTEKTGLNPGSSSAGKLYAYACTFGSGPAVGTVLDGLDVVVYHTADNGSFEAYTPHLYLAGEVSSLIPSTLRRLKAVTSAVGAPLANSTGDLTYANVGAATVNVAPNASNTSLPTLPQGGFSDTEYVLNQLNLNISRSLEVIGSETATNVGQGFALAVSWPLYNKLQEAQGIHLLAGYSATNYAAGVYQPTINRQKYSSLVSAGGVTDKDARLFNSALPAGSDIQVQRRVGTSGTQSASNAFFLNTPCASGAPGGGLSPAGNNAAGSVFYNSNNVEIVSNAGSGDVKAKLTSATDAGKYAIGVLSLENVPSSSEKFAYVKLNGVSPNIDAKQRQTAIAGDYEFWYELVAFKAGANGSPEGEALIDATTFALGDPAITDLTGLFVTPAAGYTGSNVSKGYKNGNACSPAIQNL